MNMVNIQISVILWTVICFLLLMLILKNLLFKPLLACMDRRKQRIADAENKQRSDREREQEAASIMDEALREHNSQAKTDAERKVAEERIQIEQMLARLSSQEQDSCLAYQKTLDAERQSFEKQTEAAAGRLGELFVSGFVSRK